MMLRLLILPLLLFWPVAAVAIEQINDFSVEIDVQKSGDILVSETLAVTSEGRQIRRGIFRDLPRYYEKDGARLPYDYDVKRVTRDGASEPYKIERIGNAYRIRIGDADVFLASGGHVYEIDYAVKNQVRYFDGYDEVYWNVTGNYWAFPIKRAHAVIRLPDRAATISTAGYTGRQGANGGDYRYALSGDDHVFTTTRALNRREGLTVAVGFEKGVIDPPSAADRRAEWFRRHASSLVLSGALTLLLLYYAAAFIRVGRDPIKGPVFPRYAPPEGYSPAGVHYIYHRRLAGHQALIATFLNLAVKDGVRIEAEDKKKTTFVYLAPAKGVGAEEETLARWAFNGRKSFALDGEYDSAFTEGYERFKQQVSKRYGKSYFRWNSGYLIAGVAATVAAVILAANLSVGWTPQHTAIVVALGLLSAVFAYFLPAPTIRGQNVRTEIEGFRLYLKTAEKLHLNAAKPGTDTPPPMTTERYERFLPYAAALGVEEPWTRHFEKLIPEEAQDYQPRWAHGARGYNSAHGFNRALMSGMASGVPAALPQSSGSSGSMGGGFSGGGGGGGGGGGW